MPQLVRESSREPLAQLVEHMTFNQGVLGSSPRRLTTTIRDTVITPSLGSCHNAPPDGIWLRS